MYLDSTQEPVGILVASVRLENQRVGRFKAKKTKWDKSRLPLAK
jgi:hypothetical protein